MKNSFKFFSKSAMPGGTNFVSRKYQNWTFYRVQVHDGFNFCVMRVRLLGLLSFQYITRSAIIFCFMIQWNTNHQLPTSSLARRTFVFIFCKTSAFSTLYVLFRGEKKQGFVLKLILIVYLTGLLQKDFPKTAAHFQPILFDIVCPPTFLSSDWW